MLGRGLSGERPFGCRRGKGVLSLGVRRGGGAARRLSRGNGVGAKDEVVPMSLDENANWFRFAGHLRLEDHMYRGAQLSRLAVGV